MQPRVYKTPAIVLRQRRLADADKILTLYTARLGKIEAVAKGVRKSRSRLAGHVEPLSHAVFMLAQGKTLDVVTQVETTESFAALRDDLEAMSRALYAAELVDKFTEPRAENFALYRLLLDTLRRIAAGADMDTPLRFHEMALLTHLGYTPELDACVACRSRLEPVVNFWSAGAGGVVCRDCRVAQHATRPISPNAIKLLRLLRHGRWPDVARIHVDAELALELERALGEYVRWVLERDVRSAAFIDAVRRGARAGGRRPAEPAAPREQTVQADEPSAALPID